MYTRTGLPLPPMPPMPSQAAPLNWVAGLGKPGGFTPVSTLAQPQGADQDLVARALAVLAEETAAHAMAPAPAPGPQP